jgi:hypothetical protein
MKALIIITILAIGFSACNKLDIEKDVPNVIKDKIETFSESSIICSDAEVNEYRFQGSIVYVFDPGINCGADLASEVTNSDGETLGYLGGFSGNTTINGDNFDTAVFLRQVWKN